MHADDLKSLRDELAALKDRVAALEVERGTPSALWQTPNDPPVSPSALGAARYTDQGLSEEVLLVISAAVAAFLGKKGHIRQIRLLGASRWAQQGRVTVQASHTLTGPHTRS
jgi:methylmalonyl-CoA carboxyltransferase large subunit